MSAAEKVPPGVTAVLIDPQGRAVADATCFDRSYPSGFTLAEAQRRRARIAACGDYIRGCCNGYVAAVIAKGYPGVEGVVNSLVSDHGFRLHFIEHGHEPARKE